ASKAAIDLCHEMGMKLYYFEENNIVRNLPQELAIEMNTRNSFVERWNSEIIWANPRNTTRDLQVQAMPKTLPPAAVGNNTANGHVAVPLRIASLFYSKNGVPITEDITWPYNNRFDLRVAG